MALGRSNSLSLNTGATNSLFAQQQQQNPTTNKTSGNLFGTANNAQSSQPQQTGGLFGSTNNPQNTTSGAGGLFGGGLGANTQQISTQSTGGGLFGSSGANANTQQSQPQTSSLFGGNAQQSQPQPQGGLFGSSTNTGGIFGGTGIFAGQNSAPNMFSQQSTRPASNSLFPQAQRPATMQQPQPQPQAPSLLGAAQHAQLNQSTPFGRLSMGQGGAAPNNTVSANSIDYSNLRPTTRFEDCIDSIRQELEAMDKMMQQQEQWAKQIEAFTVKHGEDVKTLAPDADYVKEKAEDVEQALATDAHGVEAQRRNAENEYKDVERCQRIVTNLALPQSYQYPHMSMNGVGGMYGSQQRPQQAPDNREGLHSSEFDMDLVNNYFAPMATKLEKTMSSYANNLAEIENHMRVMESSTIAQAQQLAQGQAGVNGSHGQSSEGTVRELADTLRGFEQSILGVAGVVGECREGVNELALGRLGGHLGGGMR